MSAPAPAPAPGKEGAAAAASPPPGGGPPGAPAPSAHGHFSKVVVHPLVLLSVTDHYARTAKDSKTKRAVGVLLGESFAGRLDVVNSFALPFEEDAKDGGIFFLDADYLEAMFTMFKKIAAKERVVGFYSTGPKIRPADARLEDVFRKYTPRPVLLVVDVRPDTDGLPTTAYMAEEVVTDGAAPARTFAHVPCEVGAYEAEEVGVEHLLRDINDPSVSALGADVRAKVAGVRGLLARLDDVAAYLAAVRGGALPANREILYAAQAALSLLPDAAAEPTRRALVEAGNDAHLAVYVAAAVRAVTALHDVVSNKAAFKEGETPDEAAARLKAEAEAADKLAADKKAKAELEEKERKQRAKFGGSGKEPKE